MVWLGHAERIGEDRIIKRLSRAYMEGNRGRGRRRKRWMDGLREWLIGRELSERARVSLARNREIWGRMVYEVV